MWLAHAGAAAKEYTAGVLGATLWQQGVAVVLEQWSYTGLAACQAALGTVG